MSAFVITAGVREGILLSSTGNLLGVLLQPIATGVSDMMVEFRRKIIDFDVRFAAITVGVSKS